MTGLVVSLSDACLVVYRRACPLMNLTIFALSSLGSPRRVNLRAGSVARVCCHLPLQVAEWVNCEPGGIM
jgi:hypothetical protein